MHSHDDAEHTRGVSSWTCTQMNNSSATRDNQELQIPRYLFRYRRQNSQDQGFELCELCNLEQRRTVLLTAKGVMWAVFNVELHFGRTPT